MAGAVALGSEQQPHELQKGEQGPPELPTGHSSEPHASPATAPKPDRSSVTTTSKKMAMARATGRVSHGAGLVIPIATRPQIQVSCT